MTGRWTTLHTVDEYVGMPLRVGEANVEVMAMLDQANTGRYGPLVPTVTSVAGKAILVSGHDLLDLEKILIQTQGKSINIYTHGEMLPAHGYPEPKKYPRLVRNYGGAWQDQHKEFDAFPDALPMTTDGIQRPPLSLLHLGVKDLRLGPTLPAFVPPAVLQVLVNNWGLAPVGDVESDLTARLA